MFHKLIFKGLEKQTRQISWNARNYFKTHKL